MGFRIVNSHGILQGVMSFGHAVGPQWASQLPQSPSASRITLEYGVEVTNICSNPLHPDHVTHSTRQHSAAQHSTQHPASNNSRRGSSAQRDDEDGQEWPVTVYLSNGRAYGADLVISAIGVEPNTRWLPEEVKRDASDGGVAVDRCETFASGKDAARLNRQTFVHLVFGLPLWSQWTPTTRREVALTAVQRHPKHKINPYVRPAAIDVVLCCSVCNDALYIGAGTAKPFDNSDDTYSMQVPCCSRQS